MHHKIISPFLSLEVRGWSHAVPLGAAANPWYQVNVELIPRTAAASLTCYSSQSWKSFQAASASVWFVCVWTEAPAGNSFQRIQKSLSLAAFLPAEVGRKGEVHSISVYYSPCFSKREVLNILHLIAVCHTDWNELWWHHFHWKQCAAMQKRRGAALGFLSSHTNSWSVITEPELGRRAD